MELKRHRLKGRGTSTIFFMITYHKKLNPFSCTPQLVKKDTNETVAQSHSRIRSSIFKFKKPRDMSLEISPVIAGAADIVLLTFILVWRERQNERVETIRDFGWSSNLVPLSPLDGLIE